MAKQLKSVPQTKGGKEGGYAHGVPTKFVDRDLRKVNPFREQFAPTEAEPVRQIYKMAGGC